MSSRPELKLDWCSHAAAKYACEKWHYSRQLPPFPHVRVGVWEGKFIGVVLFSRGPNRNLSKPYGLQDIEVVELARISLAVHQAPVSRIVSIALRILKRSQQGIRLAVSFADPNRGHVGSIYQAGGWLYTGQTSSTWLYRARSGKLWHPRVCCEKGTKRAFGKVRGVPRPSECEKVPLEGKHRYLMPLDAEMKGQVAPLALPYPKRATSVGSDAPADQAGEGGATPTVAL